MKKRFTSFFSAVVVACMAFAQTSGNVVYSWESPEGTVIESGGTAASVMGSDDRANYKNEQKDPDGNVLNRYYTLCLNGKKANVADSEVSSKNESCRITITLNESLQEGDSIYVTAYRNKKADGKDASIYFLYENGTEVSDSKVYANICSETADVDYDGDGAEPTTHGYLIPAEAAGSKTITLTRNSASTNLFITKFVVVRQAAEEEVQTNYTDAIVNADLSTTDAWNTEGTKGISGGVVKVGSGSTFDFSQTITLPAGCYKMTAQAAYRYSGAEQSEYEAILAGTQTHYAKLYAETSSYKYEVAVQNRYDGASDTDYAAGNGSVTVNGKYVPNSSAAVQTWFNNGQYVNELVFNVQEDGQVKIGIAKAASPEAGDYANIGAWTLTRLGDAEVDPVEVESPWVGSVIENGKTYYLYNPKAKAFMKGANSWGTRASFGEDAVAFTAEGSGNTYALASTYGSGKYLGVELFVDQGKKDFVFAEVGNCVYTITKDGAYVGYTGANTVETSAEVNDGSYWQLLTAESIKEQMLNANAYEPIAVTPLIPGANFGRNDQAVSAWVGGPSTGGDNPNFCGEKWGAGAFDVNQTLTGLPNGTYLLQAQGYYRVGGGANDATLAAEQYAAGTPALNAILYGNDAEMPLMSIMAEAKAGNAPNDSYFSTSLGYVPQNMTGASLFFNEGLYEHAMYVTVIDGTLKIGIKKSVELNNDWVIFDNFRLTYYGDVTVEEIELAKLQEYIDEVKVLLDAAKAVEATYSEAAKAELDAAIAAAEAALAAPTQESLVAAVAPLEAAILRAERSVAINAVAGAATLNAPVAFTQFVANPDMAEGNIKGWTVTSGWQFQNNNTYKGEGAELNKFQERWQAGSGLGNTATMQTMVDMPNGFYRVSADIMATAQYSEDPEGYTTGAYWVANGDSVAVATANGTPKRYAVDVVVANGELTIGLVGINTTANWMGLDNVEVQFYGAEPAAEWIDITAERIVNGDLSSETGWTGAGVDDHFAEKCKFLAFYAGWGSLETPTAASLKQDVTLPAGEYRLTGKAFFRQGEAYSTNPTKSLGYMVAGENKVLVKTLGSVEGLSAYANSAEEGATAFYTNDLYTNVLEFTLAEETTLSIGYECDFDEMRSWMGIGSMKLEKKYTIKDRFMEVKDQLDMLTNTCYSMYQLGGVQAAYSAVSEQAWAIASNLDNASLVAINELIPVMEDMIAEVKAIDVFFNEVFNETKFYCYDLQDNSTAKADVVAAFEDVVSLTYNMGGVSTLAELQALNDTLNYASRQYMLNAIPNEGFSFDYTFLVEGVGNSKNGWTWTPADAAGWGGNFQYQNNNAADTETLKKQGYVEVWSADANKGFGRLSYEAVVPNGYYTISAYAFTNGTTSFVAGDKAAAIANTGKYEAVALDSVMITNGKMNFGLDLQGAGWVGITNIELAFTAAIPDSILYGAQRDAFVARAQEFGAFVEGNASLTMMSGIKGTYAWPLFEVIDPLVADIDNVTDMALLDSMMTAMDEATAAMKEAVVVYEEYSAIVSLFWDATDNSTALNQEVADARDLALMNSNYTGMNAATVEALEAAVVEIQNAYLAYVTNAIAKDNYMFDVTFLLASADCTNKNGWTTEGAVGAMSGQHWSGDNSNNYLEPCDWGATSWEASLSQTVSLPNGRYSVKAAGRASAGVTLTLHANENSVAIPAVGDVGGTIATDGTEWADVATGIAAGKTFANGNAGRGWNYVSVDAEVTEGTLTVAAKGVSTTQYQWASVDDFKLYCLGVPVENGIENIETVKNAVIYTISGKRVEGNVKSLEKGIYIVNGKKVLVK